MRGRGITPLGLALLLLLGGNLLRAQTVMVHHGYDLTQSLNDQSGGPALVAHGGTITAAGYVFGAGQGLQLSNPLPDPASFTIALNFTFATTSGYRKLVDFQSLAPDSGFYSLNGSLNFYPVTTAAQADIIAGQPVHVVLTRDGTNSLVTGYVNGIQAISFTDSSGLAVLNSSVNGLYFFMDDYATGQGEASGGTATRLLIFDQVLSASQVLALAQGQLPLSIPEPATAWLLGAGLVMLAGSVCRRTRRP